MKLYCWRLNFQQSCSSRNCPFEHDWADVDLCEPWIRDLCRRPARYCDMRHFYFEGEFEKLNEKRNRDKKKKVSDVQICRNWKEGKCFGANGWGGEGCQYRHYYTEDDAPIIHQQDENLPSISQFTSPYVVKMRKERETRRLEEVDLVTGRRRSWLETTEHDLIDLTGETPTKPRTPLSSLGVNIRAPALVEKPLRSPLLAPASALSFPSSTSNAKLFRHYVNASNDLASMQSASGTRSRGSLRN